MGPETISPRLRGFDTWTDQDILATLWQGQASALAAVHAILPQLALAARDITNRLTMGGRLILVGAGTSGGIAALEAAELPPTFGWPADRALYLGPDQAAFSDSAAEDDADHGAAAMRSAAPTLADAVVALAASGATPFTCAAAATAFDQGALVVTISNRVDSPLAQKAHHTLTLETGGEVPAGSTRMQAGTSQKITLNLLSVLAMTRLGRVHDGLMVELTPSRPKFRARAIRIVAALTGAPEDQAENLLLQAGGHIKQAALMARGCTRPEAAALLDQNGDNLRAALAQRPPAAPHRGP